MVLAAFLFIVLAALHLFLPIPWLAIFIVSFIAGISEELYVG